MIEVFRVLRPGGMAYFTRPVDFERDDTFEDPSLVTPQQRACIWSVQPCATHGRADQRLASASFEVVQRRYTEEPHPADRSRYALQDGAPWPADVVFVATRPTHDRNVGRGEASISQHTLAFDTSHPMPAFHRAARWLGSRGYRGSRLYATLAVWVTSLPPEGPVRLPTGGTIVLDRQDWISRNGYFGLYERPEMAVFRRLLRPGCVAVDVGANIGYWTTHMANWVTADGLVIAVEPSPRCLSSLKLAVGSRHSSVVSVLGCAAGAEEGMGALAGYETPSNSGLGAIAGNPTNSNVVPITVRPLASILADHAVTRCTLVKIDVEGFEPEVMTGLGSYLDPKTVDSFAIEVNPSIDTSLPERIATIVGTLNSSYRLFRITETGGRFRRQPVLLPMDVSDIAATRKQFNLLLVSTEAYKYVHDLVGCDQ